jgi:hypothetical protein
MDNYKVYFNLESCFHTETPNFLQRAIFKALQEYLLSHTEREEGWAAVQIKQLSNDLESSTPGITFNEVLLTLWQAVFGIAKQIPHKHMGNVRLVGELRILQSLNDGVRSNPSHASMIRSSFVKQYANPV